MSNSRKRKSSKEVTVPFTAAESDAAAPSTAHGFPKVVTLAKPLASPAMPSAAPNSAAGSAICLKPNAFGAGRTVRF